MYFILVGCVRTVVCLPYGGDLWNSATNIITKYTCMYVYTEQSDYNFNK